LGYRLLHDWVFIPVVLAAHSLCHETYRPPEPYQDRLYVHIKDAEGDRAEKRRASTVPFSDIRSLLQTLRHDHALGLLPDAKLNGVAVRVIQATPQNSAPNTGATLLYVDVEHGIVHKLEMLDERRKSVMTIALSNVHVGKERSEKRFQPDIPQGVPIEDFTQD